MEFCITILVPDRTWDVGLERIAPLKTRWGDAWRKGEEEACSWEGTLLVKAIPPLSFLLPRLPQKLRNEEWVYLSVDGPGLDAFEKSVNPQEDAEMDPREYPLVRLLGYLLERQRRWAVFFQKDCEDIAIVRCQSVSDLQQSVIHAYSWESSLPETGGFCSYWIAGC